ncbi:MAG: hypothetical protein ACOC0A_00290 [Planctomycetota bacterium]
MSESVSTEIYDKIHGRIRLTGEMHAICQEEHWGQELERIAEMSQLGCINWVYPEARHTKLEHCYGVYHLAQLAADMVPGFKSLSIEAPSLTLAALCHAFGHAPFARSSERGLLRAAYCGISSAEQYVDKIQTSVQSHICEQCEQEDSCSRHETPLDSTHFHRWVAATKVAERLDTEKRNINLHRVLKALVCPDDTAYELLMALDELDYIMRDMFWLGRGYISISTDYLLGSMRVSDDAGVELPPLHSSVKEFKRFLDGTIYRDRKVMALRKVISSLTCKAIAEGTLEPAKLSDMRDAELRDTLFEVSLTFRDAKAVGKDVIEAVQQGEITHCFSIADISLGSENSLDLERKLSRTTSRKLIDKPFNTGLFIHAQKDIRSPGIPGPTFRVSLVRDKKHRATPRYVLAAIAKASSGYDTNKIDRAVEIASFILGRQVQVAKKRYRDPVHDRIVTIFRRSEQDWLSRKEEIFVESMTDVLPSALVQMTSGELQEGLVAIGETLGEYTSLNQLFIELQDQNIATLARQCTRLLFTSPVSFSPLFLRELAESCLNTRKKPSESNQQAEQRKDILFEFAGFLKEIMTLRESDCAYWSAVPSLKVYEENGDLRGEIDIFSVQFNEQGLRAKVKLVERSRASSGTKRSEARTQLQQNKYLIDQLFPKLNVKCFFNYEEIEF